jgi:RNA 3'-terminal phosphate cyclase
LEIHPRFKGGFEEIRAGVRGALPPLRLVDVSPIETIHVVSIASEALRKQDVVARQLKAAVAELSSQRAAIVPTEQYVDSFSIGSAVTIVATMTSGCVLGGDALGERGKLAEEVGREAASNLRAAIDSGAPVDAHLADHLVPWLALRGGCFRSAAITDHTRTHCWLVEQFIGPAFRIEEETRTVHSLA